MKQWINRMVRGRRNGRYERNERGVQLVEVAIIMPVLLLLFAVTAEFGRMFFTYTTLAKGTRLAARYLTTVPLNTAANRTLYGTNAKNLVVYGTTTPAVNARPIVSGLTANNIVITQSGGVTSTIPEFVKVEISGMTYTPLLDLGGLLDNDSFSLSVPLAPSVTMRYLITQPIN